MSERWHMNRIGFVNFWLYDEEEFSFANGKLLLRGENGTGKSITTQSFIPFVLDGDRRPSHIDSFGSVDRKMEYYFLGDGEKEESTGYLYLEFKKENLEIYRTIGIGQHAKKGKPMGFWGFILLDGRRIGHDIKLYREVGTTKVAFTKQELKKCLSEDNCYTEAQKEYMALVNKYIFGFPRIEQYEQLIHLLIQVRAPKLSNVFKPTIIYNILNDSLQTLSDEDLRAMVDAMEKMDDIQENLNGLKRTYKDLQAIKNEYVKYNRYMLAQKGAAYLSEKKLVDKAKCRLETDDAERKNKGRELEELKQKTIVVQNEIDLLQKESDTLGLENLEDVVDQQEKYREQLIRTKEEIKKYEDRIEKHHENIRLQDSLLRKLKNSADACESEMEHILSLLEEYNKTIAFKEHNQIKQLWKNVEFYQVYRTLKEEIEQLSLDIYKGLECLKTLHKAVKIWDEALEECSKCAVEKEHAEHECMDAENMEHFERDSLIEAFYRLETENREYILHKNELELIAGYIQKYQDKTEFDKIQDITSHLWEEKQEKLIGIKLEFVHKKQQLTEEKNQLEEEYKKLLAIKDFVPEHKRRVTEARKILKKQNISFLPFYEAVDFSDHLTQQEKNMLECELLDAGILDSLVVAEKDYNKAMEELKSLQDTVLHVEQIGQSEFDQLIAVSEEPSIKMATEKILSVMEKEKKENALFILTKSGYFKHGMLEGYSIPEEEACFIGAAARREKREQLIKEKQLELEKIEQNLNIAEQEIKGIEEKEEKLKYEYKNLPKFDSLNEALRLVKETEQVLCNWEERYNKKTQELEQYEREKRDCEQQVIRACKMLPYSRTIEAYEEINETMQEYKREYENLLAIIMKLSSEQEKMKTKEDIIIQEEEVIDNEEQEKKRVKKEETELNRQLEMLEEFLNQSEYREKRTRLEQIKRRLKENGETINIISKRQAVLEDNIEHLEPSIEQQKQVMIDLIEKEKKLRSYFEEELQLGLVFPRGSLTIQEAAKQAFQLLKEQERNRSLSEVVSSLLKTFHGHTGSLTTYSSFMEECFSNDKEDASILRKRHQIVSYMQGKKLYFDDFFRLIKENIDSTELMIKQKDRELFENILSDTLSRKLNARIAESRKWIRDMSQLMKQMDTSMSLSFSLDWKAKSAESEGELNTADLEKMLNRDKELLTTEDIEKLSAHFRNKVYTAKRLAEENGEVVNYVDLVRDALDYRKWFEFKINYYRNDTNKKELTNSAFNRFSGGEKAIAMYVPLFAAVNAQYKKTENQEHPRLLALDEAFAGVDDKNINSMFELVQKLDFDYIMNSQVLWGCYESVQSLCIAVLQRPANSQVVTVIHYLWNGRERIVEK